MPLNGKERTKERDIWMNIGHNADNQKNYNKPKEVRNNHTKEKAIKVKDIKNERLNRKP